MKKIIHPADVPVWNGKKFPMFCKIEFTDGNLSISGVIGPTQGGNARGGAGQIDMEFDHEDKSQNDSRYQEPIKASSLRFAPGWNRSKWYKFLDAWHKWHLNNMKSTCEHQEALGWTYEEHHGNAWHYDTTKEPDEEGNYPIVKDPYKGDACPVCGHEIGSARQKRAVPQDVIDFLFSLPDTDRLPNWV